MIVKRVKKIYKQLFMVFIMVFSVFGICNLNVNSVSANSGNIPIKRIREIKYPSALGDYSTWVTEINGNIGYCLEASKNTPVNGNYVYNEITNNENLLKTLYYGCGGPADIISTDGLTPWDEAYVLTHVAASYYYSGDLHGVDLEHVYPGWWNWITQTIPSMPTPTTEFNFSENSLTAYYDKINNEQRTQEITFNSVSAQIINIPLQDGVTLHNLTKGVNETGNVTVSGGDTFYLSAPLGIVKDTWLSGNISGSGKTYFAPLAIMCGGNYQTLGSFGWKEDPRSIELSSKWLDVGSLELRKTNDVGNFIDGAEFSLESVSFDGYSEKLVVKDGKIKVDNLPVGIYKLTETKVPDGHAITQTVYEIEIKKDEIADKVVVNKLRPTGSLIINKSLENENEEMPLSEENSNIVNVADYDFSKVQFKITANQVIKDSVSLETLYKKGDPITVGSGKGSNQDVVELISGKDLGKGVYTPDNNGRLELNGLPMGSYNIEEISCSDGFVLDKEIKTVQFVQEDFVTLSYTSSLNINNKLTKTIFSKADVGGTQINGAHVQILNKDKEVIYEFVTSDEPLQIDGLKDGKYYFHEDLSPLGFALSNDIEFTVKDSEIQKVEMTDYIVDVAKVDEQSNYLKGVGLEIVSERTKNLVDKWTTGEHIFNFSDEMIAKLENNETVSDIFISEDDSTVLYKAVKTDKDDYMLMLQSNDETNYYFVDKNGDETRHLVRNLINDSSYILRETDVPKGYSTAEEQKFTLKDENVSLTMINETIKTSWHKVDVSGNELEGAHLRVTELDGTVIDEWISTKEPHAINGVLEKNKEYYFEETIAPDGYELAQKVKFKIDDTGKVQHFYLTNNLKPKKIETGDNSDISSYLGLGLVSVGGIILISILRKKGKVIGK
ncbi:SpaA isopeptide-forming pilin-related protein [Thomasclavelia ramosa]|uniref:SpaA isopeptide-forming pilin-related protein n=1 Tax=Thomasclavelia ramosa TaxID=1547 RepID=UPI00191FE9B3|nr:SpaA isopeptide-forming pilin-related protein [Thomasclavelia ramosa]MCR1958928.1 SpaA isopeptide-forming pilin-related protein [Thomasclavelia ramosa]QQV04504.1 hypothetical protein I6I62_08670 [Thomasclavelia ramosa]